MSSNATDLAADLATLYGLDAIEQRTRAVWPHFAAQAVQAVDSTNSELMRRARQGQCTPTLLIAREQTAGKGRLGKAWASSADTSLTFSLGITLAPADWSGLSLVVGIAVMQGLQQLCGARALHTATAERTERLGLKWPNDIWSMDAHGKGRKLGGILVETASLPPQQAAASLHAGSGTPRYAVVGIGLNVHMPPAAPDSSVAPNPPDVAAAGAYSVPPASLDEWLPAAGTAADTPTDMSAENLPAHILRAIIPSVAAALARFEVEGFAPWQAAFAQWDVLHQRAVNLSDGQSGIAAGVNAQGELLLQTTAGAPLHVNSGEVSVRPAG